MRAENDPTKKDLEKIAEEIESASKELDAEFSDGIKRYKTDPEYARQIDMEADAFPQTQ